MQLLYDFLPVILFFLAFKFYNIYAATIVGIVATSVQVVTIRLWTKKWNHQQLITLFVFLIFGGLTLYFHNPIFVKWKPTILFWIFSGVLVITQFFSQKPLVQRLMEKVIEEKDNVPLTVWKRLNLIWTVFFAVMGAINLYIAYHFSDNAWVNFKFYGVGLALLVFSIFQALYLAKYISNE